MFILILLAAVPFVILQRNPLPYVASLPVALYFLFAIKVARQWEGATVLRLNRYVGLRGPCVFLIVPVLDSVSLFVFGHHGAKAAAIVIYERP